MKSTNILAATLSLVSLIGLSACGAKKPADTVSLPDISGKPDQSVTQQQTPDLETEPVLPENIYEAENFTFNASFPDAVGGINLDAECKKNVYVTIGLFTVVQLIRNVQMLVACCI